MRNRAVRAHSAALLAALLMAVSGPVESADQAGCAAFKWPLDRELVLFTAAQSPRLASGATLATWPGTATLLELQSAGAIHYAQPPEHAQKPGAPNGAILIIAAPPRPGRYQVTLSAEAWIDLIQDGTFARSYDHTSAPDCPTMHKSVRFELSAEPVTLQLSSAKTSRIAVTILPVD